MNDQPGIRQISSARALIIRDGKVLFEKIQIINEFDQEFFYILPGGGQNPGETLHETLTRECREELSLDVNVGDLQFIREYIGRNHNLFKKDLNIHRTEFTFLCEIEDGVECEAGSVPDAGQIGIEWLPIDRLSEYPLYPYVLQKLFAKGLPVDAPVFLGDVT